MKSVVKSLWKRRWCRVALLVTVPVALALMHPYLRQSLFGPTIDDVPWCVWEDDIRYRSDPDREKRTWFYGIMKKIGILKDGVHIDMDIRNLGVLAVLFHLAEDRDPTVRQFTLDVMGSGWYWKRQAEIIPVLLRHREDDVDPSCRFLSAYAIWRTTKNTFDLNKALAAACDLPSDPPSNSLLQGYTVDLLESTFRAGVPDSPELFDPVAKLADASDMRLRRAALRALVHFGKRGVATLRKALQDRADRIETIRIISRLRRHAVELVPDLLVLQNDPDWRVRGATDDALTMIAPERFSAPLKTRQ